MGLVANIADVLPELLRRGVIPDLITDQTSAHDPLVGYVPTGLSLSEAAALRETDPKTYIERARATMVQHLAAMLALGERGAHLFDYGNNLRGQALLSSQAALAGLSHDALFARIRALCRPTSTALLRGQRPLPLGGAVG